MYDGANGKESKMNIDFEFEWFLNTLEIEECYRWEDVRNALLQLFCGAARIVLDYRWIAECKGYDLSGIKIGRDFVQDSNGQRGSEILGKWSFRLFSEEGTTTCHTLECIEKDMERFLRMRFHIEEPKDLNAIKEEYQRKQVLDMFVL